MKKAFDQTVRDLKREVNKKVLKVPGIEQKVLDATSNEPWGPHGSHLADIAQATRNFNEYQMIMAVLWKRINDTGKNWRHVYKALTVLEYLVAHGSERVIDEIREHAYQISTLSDFQYIDSSGRDQGSNVRKKSQSLVVLVNDKERIQEVRQKAVANREKYRGASSTGGIYKPSSYSSTGGGYGDRYYDDRNEGRYGNRDEDRNGFGREREWGHRDDDRYSGDGYRDDGQSNDDYGSRSRSTDRERDRAYEDDVQYSSRSGGGRPDDYPQDERRLERKLSGQPTGVPPSYEEAVSDTRSHSQNDRDGGSQAAPAPKAASPPNGSANQASPTVVAGVNAAPVTKEVDAFDEFDPRGSVSAVPPTTASAEMDIFGSIADLADPNALAIMPVTSATTSEPDAHADPNFGTTFVALSSASTVLNQPSEDPFGEIPFRATPSQDPFAAQPQNFGPNVSFPPPSTGEGYQSLQPAAPKVETSPSFDFGDSFQGLTYTPASAQPPQTNQEFSSQGLPATHPSGDILADILPPSGLVTPLAPEAVNFLPQPAGLAPLAPQPVGHIPFAPQELGPAPPAPQPAGIIPFSPQQLGPTTPAPLPAGHFPLGPQVGGPVPLAPQSVGLAPLAPQPAATMPSAPLPVASQLLAPPTAALAPMGLPAQSRPQKDKFEPKSTVWADTLSRGLVNLNISGPKINPLADIGIDFESINRKEKREKEKSSATPATNPITMGKAMGSGSGIGRAGSSGIVPPPNPMMGMGMGMGGAANMGMGGYAGLMNQPMGMGGYSGGMNQPMGMGMNMGMNGGGSNMGMGAQLRPAGMPPSGPGMPMGYNPMMGMGGYGAQQPYGGYR